MKAYKQIPNLLTACNIICGCLGLFADKPIWMAFWVFVGMGFDFLDGFAARLLNAYSEIGKQLDSLADMITFGALPGMILYEVIHDIHYMELIYDEKVKNYLIYFAYIALLIPVFAAFRLARFNLDTRQSKHFIGLPTPTGALLIASLPWIMYENYLRSGDWIEQNSWLLFIIGILLPYLFISEIRLFSLKITGNILIPLVFVICSLILLILLHFLAVPIIFILYFVFSFIYFKMQTIE